MPTYTPGPAVLDPIETASADELRALQAQEPDRPLVDVPGAHVGPVSDPTGNQVLGSHPLPGLDVSGDGLR